MYPGISTRQKFGEFNAINDLNLKKGEIYELLGPDGAGKTTTINIFSGFFLVDRTIPTWLRLLSYFVLLTYAIDANRLLM